VDLKLSNYLPSANSETRLLSPPCSVEQFLVDASLKWPDKIALDFYDRTFSFSELTKLARNSAKGFCTLGVGPGVRVALHLPNTPHYIISYFGILMAGGTVVNINPTTAPLEVERLLRHSGAWVLVTMNSEPTYSKIVALSATLRLRSIVICSLTDFMSQELAARFAGTLPQRGSSDTLETDFSQFLKNDGTISPPNRGDLSCEVAMLQYTGGTTGIAKGAMLTHANLAAAMRILETRETTDADSQEQKMLAILPLTHIFGLTFIILRSVATGASIVLHLKFDPTKVLEDISGKRVSMIAGVPTMFSALMNHPNLRNYDLSSLQFCASGGAPLPGDVRRQFYDLTRLSIEEGYGLTETAALATQPSTDGEGNSTVGIPVPFTVIEVVDLESGMNVLPIGETGEICITGPQLMLGYWNDHAATEEVFRGGRFHTGDIGFIDSNGHVFLIDRKKDILFFCGYKIFPRNIEDAINDHPAVVETTVIGIPKEGVGDVAKAFVSLKAGCTLTYSELCRFLSSRLASYELPVDLEIRASLPRTPAGKLSRKELVEEEMMRRSSKASSVSRDDTKSG
jgi:long-chain acyl-CoA synthetase